MRSGVVVSIRKVVQPCGTRYLLVLVSVEALRLPPASFQLHETYITKPPSSYSLPILLKIQFLYCIHLFSHGMSLKLFEYANTLRLLKMEKVLSKFLRVTIILPVVLYGCETWSLTLREKSRLRVFENRILR